MKKYKGMVKKKYKEGIKLEKRKKSLRLKLFAFIIT